MCTISKSLLLIVTRNGAKDAQKRDNPRENFCFEGPLQRAFFSLPLNCLSAVPSWTASRLTATNGIATIFITALAD